MADKTKKPEFFVIRETITKDLPEEVRKAYLYYLVDISTRTYCASLTPSAWLEFLQAEVDTDNESLQEELEADFNSDIDISHYADWYQIKEQTSKTRDCVLVGPSQQEWDEAIEDREGDHDAAAEQLRQEHLEHYRSVVPAGFLGIGG